MPIKKPEDDAIYNQLHIRKTWALLEGFIQQKN
jgi:hypothetical protein